jgi:hypothetical protein
MRTTTSLQLARLALGSARSCGCRAALT